VIGSSLLIAVGGYLIGALDQVGIDRRAEDDHRNRGGVVDRRHLRVGAAGASATALLLAAEVVIPWATSEASEEVHVRIGVCLSERDGPDALDKLIDDLLRAADDGFASAWMSNIFGLDALTALAVAGSRVPGIALGTAVVPTYPRHPAALAQQARTVALATRAQRVGTAKVGRLFGPVMTAWFVAIGATGVAGTAKESGILRALSPTYQDECK
jgi:hypothetical protein